MTSAPFRGFAACLISAAALPAVAEDFPRLARGIAVEIEDDVTFASTDRAAEPNDPHATVGAGMR